MAADDVSRVLERALKRERAARHAAEELLETKSAELYEKNQELLAARHVLEERVNERTSDLEKARDEALSLMEQRTVFLARISHELRTPLNAILGIVDLMQQDAQGDLQQNQLGKINTSSRMLLEMINEILDYTKIESGELSIAEQPCDVAEIVSNAVDMLSLEADRKNVSLYVQVRAGLPQKLLMDPYRVGQIVINLLSNAVKFTDEGSVTVALDIHGTNPAKVEISVTDTGSGIAEGEIETAFTPFKQVHHEGRAEISGTGLGLAIVKRICDRIGGEVNVESTLGRGSKFTVSFPARTVNHSVGIVGDLSTSPLASRMVKTPAESHSAQGQTLESYRGIGANRPLKILVADDNEVNREVVAMQLDFLGYSADYVSNGEEAVLAVDAKDYDLVLLDIGMPVLDGIEACRLIRVMANKRQPFITAVTANAMRGDREKYLAEGMDEYLAKPLAPLDLAKLIERISPAPLPELVRGTQTSPAYPSPVDLLDVEELGLRLGEMMRPMLQKLVPVFSAELPKRIDGIHTAHANEETLELAALFHALKGASASVGATVLNEQAATLEVFCKGGKLPMQTDIEAFVACAQQTAAQLQTFVGRE